MTPSITPLVTELLQQPELLLNGFVKVLLVIGSLLYALFALLVIRQIQLMRSTLHTTNSIVLILIGVGHFILSIGVVLYFLSL